MSWCFSDCASADCQDLPSLLLHFYIWRGIPPMKQNCLYSLPAKCVTFRSLCHGNQRVGDRSANVGSHDDRNSHLDCKYCQSTQIISSTVIQLLQASNILIIILGCLFFAWMCLCVGVEENTHVQRRPCLQLQRKRWTNSGPAA